MDQTLIQENKEKLEAERDRLRTVLGHGNEHDGEGEFPGEFKPQFTEAGREEGENASEVEQFANDLGVTNALEEKLKRVENALQRIEDGKYGINEDGTEMDPARLRALPEAG
jgi:RNA polymerase-binding transcription factor DksA